MEYSNAKQSFFEKIKNKLTNVPDSVKEIREFLKSALDGGIISQDILFLLEKVLIFSDLEVKDVMANRGKVDVIKINEPLKNIVHHINTNMHSRYPVIGEDKDEILGVLHSKDLFKFFFNPDKFDLKVLLREAFFTPESRNLISLIKEFRDKHLHLAIVVDEFGGVSGIITFEDIIEQIIGKIEDEFDKYEEENISLIEDNKFKVNSVTKLEEFNSFFKSNIKDSDTDTIGGYIISKLGRLPITKEEIILGEFKFYISKVDLRRIYTIIVLKKDEYE